MARTNGQSDIAKLKKTLKLQEVELKIYRELGEQSVKEGRQESLLIRLMDYVLKVLEVSSGTLYLLDRKTGELSFEVVKGPVAESFKGLKMRVDRGIAGRVAKTGRPYVSSDLKKDRFWLGVKATGPPGAAMNIMAVPLKIKKRVIGVIEVMDGGKNGKGFDAGDLGMLTSIANHFSIVMERREQGAALERKVKQSATLNEVGALLISTLDERLVRERSIQAITKLVNAEVGSLLLVDRKKKELSFEVALGKKGERLKTVRVKMGQGIAGWVARYGKPLNIADVTKDKRFERRFDRKSRFKTRNMLCVPVKIKGSTIGVLQAVNKKGGSFSDEDMESLLVFSNQVAIALDNARLYHEIRALFISTSEALADAIEKRDPYTGGHTKRVFEYSLAIGRELDFSKDMLEKLKLAAVLHDVGKIGVDDSILRKQAPLDQDEMRAMMKHSEMGVEILNHIPQLSDIMPGILHHHERIDGKGYPSGIRDGRIPLLSRIIAVADTYDAMTTTRPYRKGLPKEAAINELKKFSGVQFDAEVVTAFIRTFKKGKIII